MGDFLWYNVCMNKNTWPIVVVVLVIIIIILVGKLFYPKKTISESSVVSPQVFNQQQNQPTQTNANPKPAPSALTDGSYRGNNFSVAYPSSYVQEDNVTFIASVGARAVEFMAGDTSDQTRENQILYTVYIKDDIADNQALSLYTKSLIKHLNGDQNFPINEKTVTVAGRTGIQFSYQAIAGGYNGTVYVTSVVHDKKAYIIYFVNGSTADYMKFISSFNFVD